MSKESNKQEESKELNVAQLIVISEVMKDEKINNSPDISTINFVQLFINSIILLYLYKK